MGEDGVVGAGVEGEVARFVVVAFADAVLRLVVVAGDVGAGGLCFAVRALAGSSVAGVYVVRRTTSAMPLPGPPELASGSVSLASRAIVTGVPAGVVAVSSSAIGGW